MWRKSFSAMIRRSFAFTNEKFYRNDIITRRPAESATCCSRENPAWCFFRRRRTTRKWRRITATTIWRRRCTRFFSPADRTFDRERKWRLFRMWNFTICLQVPKVDYWSHKSKTVGWLLFLDLLRLNHDVPNNGTLGYLDELIVNMNLSPKYQPLNLHPVL